MAHVSRVWPVCTDQQRALTLYAGTALQVEVDGQRHPSVVQTLPFYSSS